MFTATHKYVSVIGTAYNATEHWQFGFRLTDPDVATNDAVAFAIATHMGNWWKGLAPFNGAAPGTLNTHNLTEIKVATIQTDGKYPPNEVSASYFFIPTLIGNNAPPAGMAPQNTVACTLTTAVPRGLASKGRIFLPPTMHAILAADGRMPIANAQALLLSVRTLINQINNDPTVGNVAVMSRGKGVPSPPVLGKPPKYTYPNPGATAVVTGVQVGRVVDTQRRRRRSLDELPEKAPL